MKKYQLIGRRKPSNKIRTPEYSRIHIHSLPLEILIGIFNHLSDDVHQLVNLSYVCQKFKSIINKYYLYREIKFHSISSFAKFTDRHLPNRLFGMYDTSANISLIQSVEFNDPPIKESDHLKTKIAGSYDVESIKKSRHENNFNGFTNGLSLLLQEDFNLKSVTITEISPHFQFDDVKPSLLNRGKRNLNRQLDNLVLKTQSGWSIPFKLNHISLILDPFSTINVLELHDFIIDESKLSGLVLSKDITLNHLVLDSCSFTNRKSSNRQLCPLFRTTSSLSLLNINHSNDLSVIDFIKLNKNLGKLTIDLGSNIFYEENFFNFKSFNPFFKLICSKTGGYSKLNHLCLINFDLFSNYTHLHESSDTSHLSSLLQILSSINTVEIFIKDIPNTVYACKKCGSMKTEQSSNLKNLTKKDWYLLLDPLISETNTIKIKTQTGTSLFQKSEI